MTSRRGFLASLVAALVGVRLVSREVVIGNGWPMLVGPEAWMTVRLNGRPVRLLRSRKVPPDHLVLFGDGRVIASSGLSNEAIVRRMEESRLFLHGRGWVAISQRQLAPLSLRDDDYIFHANP